MADKVRLEAELVLKDKFSQPTNAASGTLQKFQSQIKGTGIALTAMGAAGALAFGMALKSAMSFEKGMKEVNTLVNLSAGDLSKLSAGTLQLSKSMGIDATDATKALYQAISAGQKPSEALEFLTQAAKTAVGGITDLATATTGITSIMNAFSMETDKAEYVSDILFTAMKGGITTVEELSDSFFQVAPIAASLGVNLDEVAAAATTLTKAGVPTKIAFTSLRQAIISLARPTTEMDALLEKLGYTSGLAAVEALGLQGTYQALTTETGATQEEFIKAVGAIEAMQAVLGITGMRAEEFDRQMAEMSNSAGATQTAFEVMSESASFKMDQMKASLSGLVIQIGTNLLPLITPLITKFTGLIEKVGTLDPALLKVGIAAVAVATGFAAIAGPILIFMSMIPNLILGLTALKVAALGSLGPLGLIIGVAGLAIAGGTFLLSKLMSDKSTTVPGLAGGGGLPEGVSMVGEAGPEFALKRGGSVEIIPAGRIPGFQGGTAGPSTQAEALQAAIETLTEDIATLATEIRKSEGRIDWGALALNIATLGGRVIDEAGAGGVSPERQLAAMRENLVTLTAQLAILNASGGTQFWSAPTAYADVSGQPAAWMTEKAGAGLSTTSGIIAGPDQAAWERWFQGSEQVGEGGVDMQALNEQMQSSFTAAGLLAAATGVLTDRMEDELPMAESLGLAWSSGGKAVVTTADKIAAALHDMGEDMAAEIPVSESLGRTFFDTGAKAREATSAQNLLNEQITLGSLAGFNYQGMMEGLTGSLGDSSLAAEVAGASLRDHLVLSVQDMANQLPGGVEIIKAMTSAGMDLESQFNLLYEATGGVAGMIGDIATSFAMTVAMVKSMPDIIRTGVPFAPTEGNWVNGEWVTTPHPTAVAWAALAGGDQPMHGVGGIWDKKSASDLGIVTGGMPTLGGAEIGMAGLPADYVGPTDELINPILDLYAATRKLGESFDDWSKQRDNPFVINIYGDTYGQDGMVEQVSKALTSINSRSG